MVERLVRERNVVITPNNPVLTGSLVECESLRYRRRIMHVANMMRLVFALLCVIFAPLLLSGKMQFIWCSEFVEQNTILLFGCAYIVLLSLITLYSLRGKGDEGLFLVNALVDIFFAVLFLVSLDFKENWQWLVPFMLVSLALSLLTLNIFQCACYAFFVFWELVLVYLLWSMDRLNFADANAKTIGQSAFDLWSRHDGELIGMLVVCAALSLILFLVGYLANNARENGIMAKLNRTFYEQSRSLNESIIAEMPSGLIVLNVRNEIVAMNRIMRERFRIRREESMPLTLKQLSPLLARQLARWLDLKHNDLQPLNLFGETYTATFTPLPIAGYSPLIMISLENTEAIYQRVRETRLASLGRLTAGIAHEIRNPLGSIQSANELLAEARPDDEKLQGLCHKIQSNSRRINAIISDILDMFTGRPSSPQLLALNDFLRNNISNSRNDNDLELTPISLNAEETKECSVFFDPGHLGQILHNLMLNAMKHGGRKDIEIIVQTHLGEGGRGIYLDVIDNGRGVPENLRERIFEPFYSSDREGTGLGLYLVREMCLANQAHIIYVHRAQGASFRIIMERYLTEDEDV